MTLMHVNGDLLRSAGLLLGATVLAVVASALVRRKAPAWFYVAAAFLVLMLDEFLLFRGFGLLPALKIVAGHPLSWNWIGKVYALAGTVTVCLLWRNLSMKEFGFTLRQPRGSLVPVCIAILLICALEWGTSFLDGGGKHPDAETLLYQATMPGLEEEPLWRGLFLVLLNRAFQDARWTVAGAKIGWGAILSTFAFAVAHGLAYSNGAIQFSGETVLIVGAIGFLLAWIRERTGSLLMPILAHNIGNLGNHLLYFLY